MRPMIGISVISIPVFNSSAVQRNSNRLAEALSWSSLEESLVSDRRLDTTAKGTACSLSRPT